jgi:hypothetical protein
MKKVININDGMTQVVLTSNCKWAELDYKIPEWNEEDNEPDFVPCFNSGGHVYFLDEFMRLSNNCHEWEKEFDGVLRTSYFTGIYIKLNKSCDGVQIWHMRQ